MTVAVLGGTFNPVHIAHVSVALEVRHAFGYDLVLLIPSNIPAHKDMDPGTDPAHRVRMLELAVAPYAGLAVDETEVKRGGVSYTVDTIADIRQRYPVSGKPGLVIGDDLAVTFDQWRDARRLAEETDLVVAHRTSVGRVPFSYPHRYCDNVLLQLSSTEIRRRISAGRPVDLLVPEPVIRYIRQHGLYRNAAHR